VQFNNVERTLNGDGIMTMNLNFLALVLTACFGLTTIAEKASASEMERQIRVGMTVVDSRKMGPGDTCQQAKTKNKVRSTLEDKHKFQFQIFAEGTKDSTLHLYVVHQDNGAEQVATSFYFGTLTSETTAYPPLNAEENDTESEHTYTIILSHQKLDILGKEEPFTFKTLELEDWQELKKEFYKEMNRGTNIVEISDQVASAIPIAGNTRGSTMQWPKCLKSVEKEPFKGLYIRSYHFKYINQSQ